MGQGEPRNFVSPGEIDGLARHGRRTSGRATARHGGRRRLLLARDQLRRREDARTGSGSGMSASPRQEAQSNGQARLLASCINGRWPGWSLVCPFVMPPGSLSGVGEDEIVEAVLLVPGSLAGRREKAQQQLTEVIGADAVKVVLALAARLDEAGHTKQRQVMAHRGLALAQSVAQVGDMKLTVG